MATLKLLGGTITGNKVVGEATSEGAPCGAGIFAMNFGSNDSYNYNFIIGGTAKVYDNTCNGNTNNVTLIGVTFSLSEDTPPVLTGDDKMNVGVSYTADMVTYSTGVISETYAIDCSGCFTSDLSEYVVLYNADGCLAIGEPTIKAVATDGTTETTIGNYASINDAVSAINRTDATGYSAFKMVVLKNYQVGEVSTINVTSLPVTLDLADYTISQKSLGDSMIKVASGTNLTITDEDDTTYDGTITGASANAGSAIYNEGTLNVKHITLSDNDATDSEQASSKGAVYNAGTLNVESASFADNSSESFGGAIYNVGTLSVSGTASANTTFSGNTARNGGAIYTAGGTTSIAYTTFTSNVAAADDLTAGFGGAVYLTSGASVNIASSTFGGSDTGKNSANFGGAIYSLGTLSINGTNTLPVAMSYNSAEISGGAIYSGGTLTATGLSATYNEASGFKAKDRTVVGGGAIYAATGTASVKDSTITNNASTYGYGGAIYAAVTSGGLQLLGTTSIKNNSATVAAGVFGGSTVTVGGTLVVSENLTNDTTTAKSNVYMANTDAAKADSQLTLAFATGTEAPATGMDVGISIQTPPGEFSVAGANTTLANYFTSDNDNYSVNFNATTTKLELLAFIDIVKSEYNATYDGAAHTSTIAVSPDSGLSGVTIEYSEDGTNYSTTPIAKTNAGTYSIYYRATKDWYVTQSGTLSLTIGKKTPVLNDFDVTNPDDATYNGQAHSATVAPKSDVVGMGAITIEYSSDGGTT